MQVAACCAAEPGILHPRPDAFLGIWHIATGRSFTVTLGELVVAEPEVAITGDPELQWSPDAKHLAVFIPTGFARGRDSHHDCISIVSIAAHAPVCVLRAAAFALPPEYSMFEMSWSPDASQMIVSLVHQRVVEGRAHGANGANNGNEIDEEQRDFVSAIVSFV